MIRTASICTLLVACEAMAGFDALQAQVCQGIPLEAGDHEIGGHFQAGGGETLVALRYSGSSRAFAWRALLGGISGEFPAGFPEDLQPMIGAGAAWVGGVARTCPVVSIRYASLDPGGFSVDPGDSERSEIDFVVGYGAGFSMPPDSTRPLTASVYVLPQFHWNRETTKFGNDRRAETEGRFEFETGAILAGRRAWAGAGLRVFHQEFADIPSGVWILSAGLRL